MARGAAGRRRRRGSWWALRTVAPLRPRPHRRPVVVRPAAVVRRGADAAASGDRGRHRRAAARWSCATWRASGRRRRRTWRSSPWSSGPAARHGLAALADGWNRSRGPTATSCSTSRARRGRPRTRRPAPAAGHVGQRAAGLRRPQPGHPAGVPHAGHPDATATCCRPCWSTATSPACGARSRAASRRPPSTRCPTTPGTASPPRPARWSPSSPTATRRSTAATTAGGRSCRRRDPRATRVSPPIGRDSHHSFIWAGFVSRAGTIPPRSWPGEIPAQIGGRGGDPQKTTVLRPYTSTRCARWARTARASTIISRSRPLRTRSTTLSRWLTRTTSCSMIGPSSSSAVA